MAGYVSEIFRSIQGEGIYNGVCQVFVRFAGCRRSCMYCDTPRARERTDACRVAAAAGVETLSNPVTAAGVAERVRALAAATPGLHSLSVTGGEPLEQPAFLVELLGLLAPLRIPIYLETNGLEAAGAADAIPLVDIVSLDIKLPSLCGGGFTVGEYGPILDRFSGSELFCKVVVVEGFERSEYTEAIGVVSRFSPSLPFVIQPATPTAACRAVPGEALFELYLEAAATLDRVRVIPQCHKLLGMA